MARRLIRTARKRMTKEWLSFWTFEGSPSEPYSFPCAIGTDQAFWILHPADVLELFDEPTILRIKVWLSFSCGALGAGEFISTSVGMIASKGIDQVGTVPVFGPLHNGDTDWLWTYYFQVVAPPASAGPALTGYTEPTTSSIDARAKRKLRPGEGLALMVSNPPSSDNNVKISLQGRILLAHA